MIKINKGDVFIGGRKSTILVETSVLIDTLAEKDYEGTLMAIIVGLKKHNNDVANFIDNLDDFLEDDD